MLEKIDFFYSVLILKFCYFECIFFISFFKMILKCSLVNLMNKISRHKKKTFGLLLLSTLVYTFLIHGYHEYINAKFENFILKSSKHILPTNLRYKLLDRYYKKPKFIQTNYEKNLVKLPNCNPINTKPNQFYVNINGTTYPRIVPLFHNKSINFECLNKNKRRNRILFWNAYFFAADHNYGKFGLIL